MDSLPQIPIEELQLSMQAYGFLKRTQIHAIADLENYTQEDLRILDPTAADEVIEALQSRLGITLSNTFDTDDQIV
uniref:DNA-directed RNA polymerase subunit alpha C-terminal domain-containing protein n=1 Tax=Trichocoleus desertorum TaxID=1481672 RepID=UPI0036F2EB38